MAESKAELLEICQSLIAPHHSVLEVGCGAEEALRFERQFDVVIVSSPLDGVDDIQQLFQDLLRVCHAHTNVLLAYTPSVWKPLVTLLELVGLDMPKRNRLSEASVSHFLFLAGFHVDSSIRATHGSNRRYLVARRSLLDHHDRENLASRFSVSVIIPVRNERGNLEQALVRIPQLGRSTEIIFIEGHSTDRTWETLQGLSKKYQETRQFVFARQQGRGKADAVRQGFEMASGDIVMILDGDLTVPPESLPKFYDAIASGQGECILGSRLVYPITKGAMGVFSWLGNCFFSALLSWLCRQPIRDALCGTKVLFREDYRRMQNNMLFGRLDTCGDFDLILAAHTMQLRILEIPIRYQARSYGRTNLSRFHYGFVLLMWCLLQLKDRLLLKTTRHPSTASGPLGPATYFFDG